MIVTCPECGGEGTTWHDRAGRWEACDTCGGEGHINPYEQDEWYEEPKDDEWINYLLDADGYDEDGNPVVEF